MKSKTVYIVHAIDTEGPLAEGDLTLDTPLAQSGPWKTDFNFEGSASDFKEIVRKHRAGTLGSWDQIISMLRTATSREQRMAMPDSGGKGWVYNWFCMDHLDFFDNPRRRAMGIHQVFDFYADLCRKQKAGDSLHWHFHPMSTYREANKCATSYINSSNLYTILGRRLLDKKWFPKANRAGFQDERPDSHWFLEQWIPFDLSNTATRDFDEAGNQDMALGRFTDWRWAPMDWRTYHPSHDNHQLEGSCRRKIGRCLNVLNRFGNIDEAEMLAAFERANSGKPTLVGIASHDWRDLNAEVAYIRHVIKKAKAKYSDVEFCYSDAVEAFNAVHPSGVERPLALNCQLFFEGGLPSRILIETKAGKVFGPQPFLAIRTKGRSIIHDHLNYDRSMTDFNYVFDEHSISPDDVLSIGIAANDAAGNQSIHVIDLSDAEKRSEKVSF